jgi:hypothetical protein
MGTNAYNDIQNFSEKGPFPNGKRVVIIHTTAGNLNDEDDANTCNCIDAHDTSIKHIKYWKVREMGVKNSIHLAACRQGGWSSSLPYPADEKVSINGHKITRSTFKNTVTYFMRTRVKMYDWWQNDENASAGTVDSSTTYMDWSDFVTTIYYIYKSEMEVVGGKNAPEFHIPDIDRNINPNDHLEHYQAGRAGFEAAQMLAKNTNLSCNVSLFMGYNSQNMPENISKPEVQYEAGMSAVYCLALLDYNAWPEWGPLFYEWTSRNYYRTITTTQDAITNTDVCGQDSLNAPKAKIYPNPADKVLNVKINIPLKSNLDIKVMNTGSKVMYSASLPFDTHNTFPINTSTYPDGSYLITIESGGTKISGTIFEVRH